MSNKIKGVDIRPLPKAPPRQNKLYNFFDMSNKIKGVDIRPLPKAPPRQNKKKSEPGCSRVYPDTPEKDKIEQKEEQKQLKEEKKLREGSEPACEAPALKSDVKKRNKAFKQKDNRILKKKTKARGKRNKAFKQKDNRILKKKTKARGKQTNWLSSSEDSDDSKIADKAQTSDSDILI
ncbi:hypothetical protein QE152_g10830 [Popillia japonica]|uniref:Uncharacterized protein n=1 Tax=Popillia japonica TaxID=7064 RepID=A0AAW1LSF2_POPJA